MHEELRAAFDSVHAEPELKAAARKAVARRTWQRQKTARPLGLALATAACAAVVVLGGAGGSTSPPRPTSASTSAPPGDGGSTGLTGSSRWKGGTTTAPLWRKAWM